MTGPRSANSADLPSRPHQRTPPVVLPPAAAALSPRAIAAALNGAAPGPLVAAQEAMAAPSAKSDMATDARQASAAGPAAVGAPPAAAPPERAAPPRPLREQVQDGAGSAKLLLFRVGHERFAAELGCVEEAIEPEVVTPVAGMPEAVLGVVRVRDRLLPLYSPAAVLGTPLGAPAVALVARAGDRRVALAVDDVLDVLDVPLAEVKPAPTDGDDVIGVVRSGGDLVTVIDWEALVARCLAARFVETA